MSTVIVGGSGGNEDWGERGAVATGEFGRRARVVFYPGICDLCIFSPFSLPLAQFLEGLTGVPFYGFTPPLRRRW